MKSRRSSSAETAQRFADSYFRRQLAVTRTTSSSAKAAATRPGYRRSPQLNFTPYVPPPRFILDVGDHTLLELISCVEERIERHKREHKAVPHLTAIALRMLREAKRKR